MKKIDNWTIAAALLVVFFASFFTTNRGKYYLYFSIITGLSTIITMVLAYFSKSRIIKNDYQGNIFILPEEDNGKPVKLKPGELYTGFDGIATPARPDKVFKVHNGSYVQIEIDGNIAFISSITSLINPGFVTLDYFNEYQQKKWKPLFEAIKNS